MTFPALPINERSPDGGIIQARAAVAIDDVDGLAERLDELAETASPQSFTPNLTATVTNPTREESGTQSGIYLVHDRLVHVWVFLEFGPTGTNGEGAYICNLPVAADMTLYTGTGGAANASQVGSGAIRDDSAPANNVTVSVQLRDSTHVSFPKSSGGFVLHNDPFTWTEDDVLSFHATYVRAA